MTTFPGSWLPGNNKDAFSPVRKCVARRGNMAHRAVHVPLFGTSVGDFVALVISILFGCLSFEPAASDSVFSASHTATASVAAARDLR